MLCGMSRGDIDERVKSLEVLSLLVVFIDYLQEQYLGNSMFCR
jgi:hypothetical protein